MNQDHTPHEFIALAVIPAGIALNLALGTIFIALRLPIYIDAVGTSIVTILVGWRAGLVTGVMSFALAGVLVSPISFYFIGTQAAIALYVHIVVNRMGALERLWRVIPAGIGLGIVADLMSAPIIWFSFQGVTATLRDLIIAALESYPHNPVPPLKAIFLSGLAVEPLDKTIQLLLAYFLVGNCPQRVLSQFPQRASVATFRKSLVAVS